MILYIDSNALYLSACNYKSQAGSFYYLSNKIETPFLLQQNSPPFNGPIYLLSKIMRNVAASATESKLGALFLNIQRSVLICTTLIELGYPQPVTLIRSNN